MKNKKYLATLLAASMLMGSSLTVFADDVAITGNTTQEVPMSMTVTTEDLEAAGNLTDVTVRIPARMTLAYKNGAYISTDKVGAFGTLPSYKKVIISNENSDIVFKNTDESKVVTGKLTLGMLNEDLVVSSEELAAGKADANNIKYSQVTAKVNTKNLENADTFSGNANLKVKIEALTTTEGLTRGKIDNYSTDANSYTTWYTLSTTQQLLQDKDNSNVKAALAAYVPNSDETSIKNYDSYIENNVLEADLYKFYKPNVTVLELSNKDNNNTLSLSIYDSNRTMYDYKELNNNMIDNFEEVAITPFMATPNLDLLIINRPMIELSNCFNSIKASNGNISKSDLSKTLYNGVFFIKDYDAENNLFIYIPNISYNGTMEQWNKIAENNWKFPKMANTVTVYCTDGIITYE